MHRSVVSQQPQAWAKSRNAALVFAIMLVGMSSGCSDDSAVVWQASAPSPDGVNVAVAKTTQYSGPGTAAVFTTVDISRADGEGKPVEILVFEDPSEPNAAAIRVEMAWSGPERLEIGYPKGARLSFRADLFGKTAIVSHPRP